MGGCRPPQDFVVRNRPKEHACRGRLQIREEHRLVRAVSRDDESRFGPFAGCEEIEESAILRDHPTVEDGEFGVRLGGERPILRDVHDFDDAPRSGAAELRLTPEVRYNHEVGALYHAPLGHGEPLTELRWDVGRDHVRIEVEYVIDESRPRDPRGGPRRPRGIEIHRVNDVGPKSRGLSEDKPLPSWQAACEAGCPFVRLEVVSMDSNSVEDLAGGQGAGPVPEDRMDLIAGPREARRLLREPRLDPCGALRADEDDAGRHVIPDGPPRAAQSVFLSFRPRTGSASPVSHRAADGRRLGPVPDRSPRARSNRSRGSPVVPCFPEASRTERGRSNSPPGCRLSRSSRGPRFVRASACRGIRSVRFAAKMERSPRVSRGRTRGVASRSSGESGKRLAGAPPGPRPRTRQVLVRVALSRPRSPPDGT